VYRNVADLIWSLVQLAACIGLFVWAFRSVRKANRTAPPAARRNARQGALNLASAFLLLPLVGYFCLFDLQHLPLAATAGAAFIVVMLILRIAKIPWRWRLGLLPFVAVAALLAGATACDWPSVPLSQVSTESWVVLGLTTVVVAVSSVLSIFSFPEGYGERAS
jgi:hypothetical protein